MFKLRDTIINIRTNINNEQVKNHRLLNITLKLTELKQWAHKMQTQANINFDPLF